MKWLLVTLLFCLSAVCNGQQMLTDKDFDMSQEGVTVVEFWADWNSKNECVWLEDIADAEVYRVDLNTDAAKKNKVTVLPTVVIFDEGEEIERFEGDITFSLCPEKTPAKVQKEIDKLVANKF
jgi:thiol-disulfide isomerase/thioredoxin|tara:strand:- start:761 stop:1129 length:369 start_codon:yes stop_codon:yes gene_type:complete